MPPKQAAANSKDASSVRQPQQQQQQQPNGSPSASPAPVPKQAADQTYLHIDPSLMQRTGLTADQLRELVEIFSLVDVDHGGTIDTDELAVLMNTLGLKPSQMELETMIKELDSENTGEIDFESFVGAMTKKLETDITPEELEKAFKIFAIYNSDNELITPEHEGAIPTSVLIEILTTYGDLEKRLTTSEAKELIKSVAPNGSHTFFDYKKFIQFSYPQ
ncbi:hypothetical protein HDU82_004540 [Entophlyctis luteolus]|nr:hypothetical protein HDU82_004540 [Entophlyctis luteolus]